MNERKYMPKLSYTEPTGQPFLHQVRPAAGRSPSRWRARALPTMQGPGATGGKLLPCLLSDGEVDLKGPLRRGCLDEDLIEVFLKAVDLKPRHHPLGLKNHQRVHRKMCSVGG